MVIILTSPGEYDLLIVGGDTWPVSRIPQILYQLSATLSIHGSRCPRSLLEQHLPCPGEAQLLVVVGKGHQSQLKWLDALHSLEENQHFKPGRYRAFWKKAVRMVCVYGGRDGSSIFIGPVDDPMATQTARGFASLLLLP